MADRVSVVIATRDRRADLMHSLPHHSAPVILVDNGSTDGTPDLVRSRFPQVDVLELGSNHGAPARNHGVKRAYTPYVAFADDDSWWAPGSLDLAADVLDDHPHVAVVVARVLVGPELRLDPLSDVMAVSPLPHTGAGPGVLGFMACAAVVRRDAFLAVGGFDDVVFFMGEEERVALDLASAGWQLAYVDDVVVHHHPSAVRDPAARQVLSLRNTLLTSVMRRPWIAVGATLVHLGRQGSVGRRAVLAAVPRLARALRRRQRLPRQVAADLARLDR